MGSTGKVFLEFRGRLILNFATDMKMSSHHERQGFEHGKVKGKPISEAISPAWRNQRSKESAKQWLCVTRAWSVGRWAERNEVAQVDWPETLKDGVTSPGSLSFLQWTGGSCWKFVAGRVAQWSCASRRFIWQQRGKRIGVERNQRTEEGWETHSSPGRR